MHQAVKLKPVDKSTLLTVVKNETTEEEKQFIDLLSTMIVEDVFKEYYEKKKHNILALQLGRAK
jgi:hypothetical protein